MGGLMCLHHVASGNTSDSAYIAHFRTGIAAPLKSLKVKIEPSLTGKASVKVTKCGINLLKCDTYTDRNQKGVAFTGTRNSDGELVSVKLVGTGTDTNIFRNLNYVNSTTKKYPPDGSYATYTYSDDADIRFVRYSGANPYDRDGNTVRYTDGRKWRIWDIDDSGTASTNGNWLRIEAVPWDSRNKVFDTTVYPMMCLASDAGCEFEAYKGSDYTVSFQNTIYGGYVDVVNGTLVKEWEHIESYNGETLPGEWISSLDTYSPGTLPTTGAEVVYKLSSSITSDVTPQNVNATVGINNIWSSDTSCSVEAEYYNNDGVSSLLELRRKIMMNTPHQVTVTGSFIHFETDMSAPMIITGNGNITSCGKNMFNFDSSKMLILKSKSGAERWGYVVVPSLCQITLSATKVGSYEGNFNINSARFYGITENAYATNTLIDNYEVVTNRTWIYITGSFIAFMSSFASTAAAAKNATINKISAYDIQCEYGSSATAFEAYKGTTASAETPRNSLVGINNIWSDTGESITVTYWKH